ncbi:hypothetical protein Q4Q34_19090 [Flavivirga abyssicola]|uniref:hypothetical protein n=1 Tax=Flavivirga abyssicola TaxID=3063533 RepID=UPI0026DEB9D4|nr:hypothetical protein [Flavivirga sp. MEBiC07777]WVK13321.1 hypothetical protein Q4Q34_19090 [Flavivirga sp. MEBiC07777]
MNNTIIKIKLLALSLLITGGLMAQQKLEKVSQSIKVNKDITIDLNTSHCNLVIDTWNKDVIEIEAYIEGDDLSKEALENALKNWEVDVDASSGLVKIETKGTGGNSWVYNSSHNDNEAVHALLEELKFELADLPEVLIDGVDFVMPEVPELPEMPQLPVMPQLPELPKLPEGVNEIQFDYKAYKKDGEKYLEEYTQKFESKFGKDYAEKMEAWGEKFGKEWEEKYGKEMKEWGEKFGKEWEEKYGKQMEEWGERFAEKMERQAAHIEARAKHMEKRQEHIEKRKEHMEKRAQKREKLVENRKVLIERLVNKESSSKIKKTIKIKMPKKAKLKVNVRHGEIEFAANVDDLKAELSHTKFTAYSINGSSTSVNASYSPVYVTHWNLGELNLRYTKDVELDHVKQMVLNSNSSNTTIKHLLGSAIIDGNIGDLKILNIGDTFSNLNIIIQNSNAVISLPKVNYNLQYKGNRSRVSHPKEKLNHNISNFSTGSLASGKSILVNAKYSSVTMQ